MIKVEESENGEWKTAYQDQSPFIDNEWNCLVSD